MFMIKHKGVLQIQGFYFNEKNKNIIFNIIIEIKKLKKMIIGIYMMCIKDT